VKLTEPENRISDSWLSRIPCQISPNYYLPLKALLFERWPRSIPLSKEFSLKKIRFVIALHELSNSSKKMLYGVVFVLFIVHMFLSIYLIDFAWFAAFGALLSMFGLLVSFSYALPLKHIAPKDVMPTEEGEHYVVGGVSLGVMAHI